MPSWTNFHLVGAPTARKSHYQDPSSALSQSHNPRKGNPLADFKHRSLQLPVFVLKANEFYSAYSLVSDFLGSALCWCEVTSAYTS